eukprot:jgi/Mesen1/7508/ME000039S06726
MYHCRQVFISTKRFLLAGVKASSLAERCSFGVLYDGPLGILSSQNGACLAANEVLRETQQSWKSLGDIFWHRQPPTRDVMTFESSGTGRAALHSTEKVQAHRASSFKLGHSIRFLSQAPSANAREDHRGEFQRDSAGTSRVDRVLKKLQKLFAEEEPGTGAASIVEALVQVETSEKDIQAIFVKQRGIYSTTFTQARAASALKLIRCLLENKVTCADVGRIIKADPRILCKKDFQGCLEVLEYLRNDLKVEHISEVLKYGSLILYCSVGSLRTRVAFLKDEMGMKDLGSALYKSPNLLRVGTESLSKKAESLRAALDVQDLGPLLDRCPKLLFVGPTVPAAAFRWLKGTLGKDAAKKVAAVDPVFLTVKASHYEASLRNLMATFPDTDALALIARSPRILNIHPKTLRESYKWLVDAFSGALGEAGAAEMVLRHPRLLNMTVPSLQAKVEFCTGVMGRTWAELGAAPDVLAVGLKSRLLPRALVMRRLGLTHHFALNTIFNISNKDFERRQELWAQPKYDKHRRFDSEVDVQDDAFVPPSVPLPMDKQAAER